MEKFTKEDFIIKREVFLMTTLEIIFIVVMGAAAVISFLQTHWFVAILIVALLGVLLWLLFSILSNINLFVIPLLLWK